MSERGGRRTFGSVRRLTSGRWQARYRDDAGSLQSAPRTFPSKGDASRWLATAEADQARGEWLDPRLGATRFDAFVDEWWPTIAHLRPTTRASYEYLLRVHLRPTFGGTAIGRITPVMVQAWRADLLASGLAPNSVAKAYRLLARVMAVAVRGRYIGHTPCMERGAGTDAVPEMRFATADQVDAIAAHVPERERALIYVAAYSSLRLGELTGLRRCDVNPLHKTVTVARQITEVRGQLHVGPPKTASSRRTVRLPDLVAAMLDDHLQRHSEPGPEGLVFPAAEGGAMRRTNFRRRVWVPATEAAGVPGLRFPRPAPHRCDARGRQWCARSRRSCNGWATQRSRPRCAISTSSTVSRTRSPTTSTVSRERPSVTARARQSPMLVARLWHDAQAAKKLKPAKTL